MPPDQQNNQNYQCGVFWLYNWFQAENNNMMYIYFLMNGNIFNYPLALEPDSVDGRSAYAIPPNPPASIFAQSYINAYSTAFNQPVNYQYALNNYYQPFTWSEVNNNNFVPGTFGYQEEYNTAVIRFCLDFKAKPNEKSHNCCIIVKVI